MQPTQLHAINNAITAVDATNANNAINATDAILCNQCHYMRSMQLHAIYATKCALQLLLQRVLKVLLECCFGAHDALS
eukprot:11179795-Lingulodinium_polyedra.AAC.1